MTAQSSFLANGVVFEGGRSQEHARLKRLVADLSLNASIVRKWQRETSKPVPTQRSGVPCAGNALGLRTPGLSSLAHTAPTQNFLGMQVALAINTVAAPPVAVRLHGPGQASGSACASDRSDGRDPATVDGRHGGD